jgi:hypothetical protein
MIDYYEPDERWEIFGITSREQYEEKYVVKGYFHDGVPNDVKEAFLTVEYLLAHAYCFWPIYDEAFNKILLILEMSIKLKAKQLKIPLSKINNKGKSIEFKLIEVINEICRKSENLKNKLNRIRTLRNHKMHPVSNSYMGGVGGLKRNIELFVNIINELFRNEEWIISQYEKQQNIQKQLKSFDNTVLVLENNISKLLIFDILQFDVKDETLFLVFNPILTNTQKALEEHKYPNPIAIAITKFEFQKDNLIGTSYDGNKIRIYKTDKAENILQFLTFIQEYKFVNQTDRVLFENYINGEAAWRLVKLEYDYYKYSLGYEENQKLPRIIE